jgi:hypothetical protein
MAHFLWIRRLLVGRKCLRELLAVTVRRFRKERSQWPSAEDIPTILKT